MARKRLSYFLLIAVICGGCQSYLSPLQPAFETVRSIAKCSSNSWGRDGVIGGRDVGAGDPDERLVVQLRIWRGGELRICTGSLIYDSTVLTAAHCVKGVNPTDIEVRVVTTENCPVLQHRAADLQVSKIKIHPDFDGAPESFADLALVSLLFPAPKDLARLPLIEDADGTPSDEVLLLGFGVTGEDKKDSQALRRVTKSLSRELKFKDRTIVVDQTTPGGFCRGDSGAPLIARVYGEPRIIGVNSANVSLEPEHACHSLSIAMNMRYFAPWIMEQKEESESKSWVERYLGLSFK